MSYELLFRYPLWDMRICRFMMGGRSESVGKTGKV
jgi:hypothetical protein